MHPTQEGKEKKEQKNDCKNQYPQAESAVSTHAISKALTHDPLPYA